MQERVLKASNITIHWNSEIQEVVGQDEVSAVLVNRNTTGELSTISLEGLFIAIGHQPSTELFRDFLELDRQGYIQVSPGSTHTSLPGIFACGDVEDKVYRQAITAAGAGCKAALDAERYLNQIIGS
jgi:thioredoxin reductase (NADPH)